MPGDAGHDRHADEESGDEAQERQGHQVEADVQPELRVILAEGFLVEEQQHLLPLAGGGTAGEEPEQHGKSDHDHAAHRLQLGLVAVEVVPDFGVRGVDRPGVVGDPDGVEHAGEHDGEASGEDADPGQVFRQEHFEEAKLLVPEDVRPHVGEENEADDDQRNDNERRRQGTALLAGVFRAGWGWQDGTNSVPHSFVSC